MRRENATFKTAFVSYEGSKLHNNDYYGSAVPLILYVLGMFGQK